MLRGSLTMRRTKPLLDTLRPSIAPSLSNAINLLDQKYITKSWKQQLSDFSGGGGGPKYLFILLGFGS